MFIPFVFVILFFLYRLFIEHKRSSIQPYLDQLDTFKDNYTVHAISTSLESLTTERQLRLLIYEGITAGNQIITSKSFVQFCLERFPRSQWMASYISFLCLLYWETNTIIYQFMLHTLSLDYFGMRNLHLFQAIFCLMQTSENLSPVIARELDEYRCEVAEFASLHRLFWKSVRNGNELSFHDSFFALHRKINSLARHVKILSMKYPYCSSIQSENALFFADIKHNYSKSSEFYSRAAKFLNSKRSFIFDEMTSNFSQLFLIPKQEPDKTRNEDDAKAIDELRFISNLEYHERALRYMTVVSSNDKYLQALSHTFSVPTNQQPVDIVFDKYRTIIIKITFYLPIVFFIIFGLIIIHFNIVNDSDAEDYKESTLILESMNLFRNQIYFIRQDARLLANILLDNFNEIVNKSIYYNISDSTWYDTMTILYFLSMEHTSAIEALFNEQFYIFSTRKVHQNVNFSIPGCDSTNCSLAYLYSDMHNSIKYMLNPKDPYRLTNTTLIQRLDDFSEKLMNLTDSTHEQLVHSHYNWIQDTIHRNKTVYWHLLLAILILSSITLLVYVISTLTLKKHVYAVIKTIQPAMLKSISSQFDKLISLEQKQTQTIQDHTFIKGILFFIASFAILFVYTVLMLLAQRYYKNNIQPRMTYLYPFPEPNDFSEFIIFMVGILEGTARWGIDLDVISKGTRLLLEMSLMTPVSCIYHLYFKTCYNCYAKTFYYEKFDSRSLWWLSYITLFLSLLCLIGFLYYTYQIIYLGRTVEDIMKFVPTSARKSNPVLQKFMAGDQIPIKEISDFARDIGIAPEMPEFFAVLYLDPLENVIQTKGQISSFLPFIPNNLGEVQEYLIRNSTDSGLSISNFFKLKSPLESRSLSINGREFSFSFSRKGSILLIKDDSHHHLSNDRTRMIERLHSTVKERKDRRKGMNLGQTVLLIIESKGKTTHSNIVKMLEPVTQVVDTRFRRIVCFSNLEKVTDIVKVTTEIFNNYGNEIRGVLHCGNSLSVLQSAVSIEKPRVFGQAYDEGRMMLSKAKIGELVQSDQFLALLI
ncbi:hypothetical protein TVAG_451140 [Trichomonas vaginalis G3]|uniref:Uncharacterized protein n=1 Tax=Trichomonas vaginalis (strain ATCC PRA-98 / G3) TaxID=412133 RepID=A2EYR7_TRIV3|nr:hypothetical protein TVAGG3_0865970 [Trichomonas vaginalis G3]EAY02214.1 hypothetical protein TVAG_451140 [Trichomonas vaginalis G3]KAI5501026.1 hypothetical protein TVAGG3_0865970 [Trichomonas vaginalis G3]|eukprot:XP_001314552.1 hypothetical protein [Trichomonas vaginalis G3]